MRKIYTLLLFICHCSDSDVFITTWKTDNAGSFHGTSITIPTTRTGWKPSMSAISFN
nr:hypothetical protein [uncultured Flavobacterium sp.]